MKSIFDNPAAFAPLYDDTVAVTGVRGSRVIRVPVRACVIEDGLDDPITDGAVSTDRRSFVVTIRRCDWHDETPPQVGDKIEYNGMRLAVESVDCMHLHDYTIRARGC